MALNFIMKGEDENFNYTDVIKNQGKLYYNISEETYNKIKKLNNIKGIYTFLSDKTDKKEADIEIKARKIVSSYDSLVIGG